MNRKKIILLIFLFLFAGMAFLFFLLSPRTSKTKPNISPYPNGKNFAFTVTDDAHGQSFEKIRPVYDFLYGLGLRTTIAVYVQGPSRSNGFPDFALNTLDENERTAYINKDLSLQGDTLRNEDYLNYIKELRQRGFEIAIHTASSGNDLRETTIEAFEQYRSIFGEYPKMDIMHSNNLENVYWGYKVFDSGMIRWMLENMIGGIYPKARYPFQGEDPGSPYFCGDILKEKIKYVRMWGTHDINTLAFNPSMPYHDPQKPYVNYWFSFSEGHTRRVLGRLLSDKNIARLSRERGASIVYTHFVSSVSKSENGEYQINPGIKRQFEKLAAQKDGWFVPVSELLDRLLLMKNVVLFETPASVVVSNFNDSTAPGVTLIADVDSRYYDKNGNQLKPDEDGEIIIGSIPAHGNAVLYKNINYLTVGGDSPGRRENANLVLHRIFVWATTVLDR